MAENPSLEPNNYQEQFSELRKRAMRKFVVATAILVAGGSFNAVGYKLGVPEDLPPKVFVTCMALFFIIVVMTVLSGKCPKCGKLVSKSDLQNGIHVPCGTKLE